MTDKMGALESILQLRMEIVALWEARVRRAESLLATGAGSPEDVEAARIQWLLANIEVHRAAMDVMDAEASRS